MSEFVVGVVLGIALSAFGAWLQAKTTTRIQAHEKEETVRRFSADVVGNIRKIAKELDTVREKARAINHDYLDLIETEVGIYGRNREITVFLPDQIREELRNFMTEVAIKTTAIKIRLADFYKLRTLSDQAQAEGRGPDAVQIEQNAQVPLDEANRSADKLIALMASGDNLIRKLSRTKS